MTSLMKFLLANNSKFVNFPIYIENILCMYIKIEWSEIKTSTIGALPFPLNPTPLSRFFPLNLTPLSMMEKKEKEKRVYKK